MARKVRVLQMIDQLTVGGAEALQLTFAQAIDRQRFALHVCALRELPSGAVPASLHAYRSTIVDELRRMGVPVLMLRQRNVYDLPALARLIAYIRRNRIDVIHTHLLGADVLGRIAGFLTRTPVVSTIHVLKVDMIDVPARQQWLARWTGRLFNRRFVVLSEGDRQETAAWFGVPLDRVAVIPNGVDVARFQLRAEFDRAAMKRELIGGDYPLAINVARMTPQKAQHVLIAAARLVVNQVPDAHFLIVGDGRRRDELAALAAELGLGERVHLVGFRKDVPEMLAAADLFVLSSLYEGMPVSLLEAMAAGLPAVSTAVGGVTDVIEDGVTGLLVQPEEPEALAAAMLEVLQDRQLAERLAAAGRSKVTGEFGMRAWAGKWERFYLRELGILARHAPARPEGTRTEATTTRNPPARVG